MEQHVDQGQNRTRSIDVTGLPDEAIAAVEQIVAVLKKQSAEEGGVPPAFSSREEWRKAVREWAESHSTVNTSAEWDRDSIYADRGE
jgi:hypothetical protein